MAVAVLAGALMVGDSVRRACAIWCSPRLGKADLAVMSAGFFREQLARELQSDARFASAFIPAPLIVLEGFVTDQAGGRRASHVQVYAVDERFWRFHGLEKQVASAGSEAMLSEGLASEIGTAAGRIRPAAR